VVGIIALMAVISVPLYNAMIGEALASSAATRIESAIGQARSMALTNRAVYTVEFAVVDYLVSDNPVLVVYIDQEESAYDDGPQQFATYADFEAEEAKLVAALAVFDRQLEDGILVSPASGTVLVRAVEPGEIALPGATALRIADLSELELRVFLCEENLDLVHLGQRMPVLVDALEGEALEGTVAWISDEAEFTPKNAQTRNARAQLVYAVKLRVGNPDGRLHIGMPAEIRL